MSAQARSWRIHLRTTTELQDLAEWINPVLRGWMTYYGQVLQDRAGQPATAHQQLPDALGATEVQTATPLSEKPGDGGIS